MKLRIFSVLVIWILAAVAAAAQSATPTPTITPITPSTPRPIDIRNARECGYGLPCGPIPWRLPLFPVLRSPTPFPTVVIQPTPTLTPGGPTATPTLTYTPSPTIQPSAEITVADVEDRLNTLEAIINSTPIPTIAGVDAETVETELEAGGATFLSYVKAIPSADFGPFSPLIQFIFLAFAFVLLIKSLSILIPVVSTLLGWIGRVVDIVLDFIPF